MVWGQLFKCYLLVITLSLGIFHECVLILSLDVNECSKLDICGQGGQCVNLPGSYKCECHKGFRSKSQRQPACEGKSGICCPHISLCVQCICMCVRIGLLTFMGVCVCLISSNVSDINECLDPNSCPNDQCENTPGSYECVPCLPGHQAQGGVCYGETQ